MTVEERHGDEQYCYLTTTGRSSGLPREIEIWFGALGDRIYLLSGGGQNAHWVMNIMQDQQVRVRIDLDEYDGTAHILEAGDEEQAMRRQLAAKYEDWREGAPLSAWARGALPVAIDLARSE